MTRNRITMVLTLVLMLAFAAGNTVAANVGNNVPVLNTPANVNEVPLTNIALPTVNTPAGTVANENVTMKMDTMVSTANARDVGTAGAKLNPNPIAGNVRNQDGRATARNGAIVIVGNNNSAAANSRAVARSAPINTFTANSPTLPATAAPDVSAFNNGA